MALIARIDALRWRAHQEAVHAAVAAAAGGPAADTALVPVIKGNGYGLGQQLLAREAEQLPCRSIAVGTVHEVDAVLPELLAEVVVLEPFEPRDSVSADAWWHLSQRWDAGRVIRTVASLEGLRALADGKGSARILIELRTSMHRFGFDADGLAAAIGDPVVAAGLERGAIAIEGASIHLPIAQPRSEGPIEAPTARSAEALHLIARWRTFAAALGVPDSPAWLSHLDDAELAYVHAHAQGTALRLRSGTRLWLGDREAIDVQATVLAVDAVPGGTPVGYRQRTGPRGATLLVVSGGTAHGIGLSAPTAAASARQRLVAAGTGALDATGRAKSPFTWQGRELWFAEPPHQQHSLVWLPSGVSAPQVGEALDAEVRFTTTRFDAVELS